jgi:acyl-CoA dehydrogenase
LARQAGRRAATNPRPSSAYAAAGAVDRASCSSGAAARAKADELAGLLTPIVKATCSEIGVEATSLGVQVHGGMGYVEETGAAQHFRDARITPIYEGTNGIQAIDLVARKALRPDSDCAAQLIANFSAIGAEAAASESADVAASGAIVVETAGALERTTRWLAEPERGQEERLAVASPYLKMFGVVAAAALLTKGANVASRLIATGSAKPVHRDAIAVAAFYAANIAVEALSLERVVVGGFGRPMTVSDFAR